MTRHVTLREVPFRMNWMQSYHTVISSSIQEHGSSFNVAELISQLSLNFQLPYQDLCLLKSKTTSPMASKLTKISPKTIRPLVSEIQQPILGRELDRSKSIVELSD